MENEQKSEEDFVFQESKKICAYKEPGNLDSRQVGSADRPLYYKSFIILSLFFVSEFSISFGLEHRIRAGVMKLPHLINNSRGVFLSCCFLESLFNTPSQPRYSWYYIKIRVTQMTEYHFQGRHCKIVLTGKV